MCNTNNVQYGGYCTEPVGVQLKSLGQEGPGRLSKWKGMAPMTEHLVYGVGADTEKSLLPRHDQFKVATALVPISLNCSGHCSETG